MDWSRFKNIAILSFVVLNLVLCVLIAEKKNKNYVLQDVQNRRMQTIFTNENAALYTNILKEFYPMSMLRLSLANIDNSEVCKTFLGDVGNIKNYIDNEKVVYVEEGVGKVEIYKNGLIKYTKAILKVKKNNNAELDKEQLKNEADKYISKRNFLLGNHVYTQSNMINDGYVFEYNTSYKDKVVFSNYVKIHIKQNEITEVDILNFNINGYTNEQKEIASADEVLINLLYSVKEKYYKTSKEMHIMDLDLGYFIDTTTIDDYLNIKAEPYYRVQINENDVYFINAYTNELLSGK